MTPSDPASGPHASISGRPAADPLRREFDARRQGRATVMAVLLGAFALLIFAITIAKLGIWG